MSTMKRVRTWCAAAVVCLMAAPSFAQTVDRRTTFTFSGPVTLPGVTLPAGSYIFRLANPGLSSRVIQVISSDGTTPYALFFAIPAERVEAARDPEVRFMETATGTAPAIRTWWYPGERIGYELVYPKEQARRLAMGAADPVLTTQADTTTVAQTNTPDLARISSGGEETRVEADAETEAAAPTGETQQGAIASPEIDIKAPAIPSETGSPAR